MGCLDQQCGGVQVTFWWARVDSGEGRGGEAAAAREQDAGLVEGSQSWPCAAASWEAF